MSLTDFSTFLPRDYTPFPKTTQELFSFPISSLLNSNYNTIFHPHASLRLHSQTDYVSLLINTWVQQAAFAAKEERVYTVTQELYYSQIRWICVELPFWVRC